MFAKSVDKSIDRCYINKAVGDEPQRCTLKIKHCKTKCKEHFSLSKT